MKKQMKQLLSNCDTHVFLGSNSQKTVEYFSKALGEKTISHESISTNRDKEHKKTGTSDSDQIMARALMTPDELRRMDNDLCIIFEKGVKPVKANKFYYFKKPMAKEMAALEISHNDIGEIERGKWRKYNPYNPYVEEKDKEPVKDLKVESLDDLFDDPDPIEEPKKESKPKQEDKKIEKLSLEDIDNDDAPMLPMNEDPEDEYDLQKELEAKFDELFGPIDDDN